MYKKFLSLFIGLLFLFTPFFSYAEGEKDIDITVSPVRYELSSNPGTSITKNIKIINNSLKEVQLNINKKDCESANSSGNPKCFLPEVNQNIGRTLAPWVSISSDMINIPAQSEKNIEFTVSIPNDANPGGHYGAIFFSYGTNNGTHMIETIKEVGVILLLNVSGEVDIEGEVKEISIQVKGGGDGKGAKDRQNLSLKETIFNLITTNFTNTFLKQKNTNDTVTKDTNNTSEIATKGSNETNEGETEIEKKQNENKDVTIDFGITFENTGNTHIKPKGKITIQDEDGNVIKRVGEETVKNDDGIIIGKKIVDYIPINDEEGNVLPGSDRIFSQNWKGFPYKKIDENGETVIDYKNLGDYYTEQNLKDKNILMMWEEIKTREKNEKMKANIDISYKGKDNEDIDFNSAKDFNVNYTEQYVGINWLFVGPTGLIFFIFFIVFIIKRRKKNKDDDGEKEKKDKSKKKKEV